MADGYIETDTHEVPFWNLNAGAIFARPIEVGDRANLWTYLDWMLSASSNAAASMVMRELVVMEHFGSSYPPSPNAERAFFQSSSAGTRAVLLKRAIDKALRQSGLNPLALRQGSLFTRAGKAAIPGSGSTATPRELVKFLVRMETGSLVDSFSSLELKRLLYLTQRRIRYSSAPALDDSAVYFKSGSLYACRPERNFVCERYHGNAKNMMNAVALIEYPYDEQALRYAVVLTSNVLKIDAEEEHRRIATKIQELLTARHQLPLVRERPPSTVVAPIGTD